MNLTRTSIASRVDLGRPSLAAEARRLSASLASCSPLPPAALFVGLAEDGPPVLLNLREPSPTPVLVAADAGAGKTHLLQTVARAVELTHEPGRTRYVVITEHPTEWSQFEHSSHCDGLLSFHHALTTAYLGSLAATKTNASSPEPATLLMIDGIEALASDADLHDAGLDILGSLSPGIWPFVTLNTSNTSCADFSLGSFHIRLFGYVRDREAASVLCAPEMSVPADLQPPRQFVTAENGAWLSIWLPELD